MAHINEIFFKTVKLKQDIENLLTLADCNNYGYLNDVETDEQDAEQIFLWNELNYIMNRLRDAKDRIEYLSCPVEEIDCLHKNKLGRYATQNGHTYTSGSRIEALITDDRYHDTPFWVRTSVEHDGTDYYPVKHSTYDGKLRIFDHIIPASVRAAETSAEGKSIYLHDPTGKVADAYAALTKEVMG